MWLVADVCGRVSRRSDFGESRQGWIKSRIGNFCCCRRELIGGGLGVRIRFRSGEDERLQGLVCVDRNGADGQLCEQFQSRGLRDGGR